MDTSAEQLHTVAKLRESPRRKGRYVVVLNNHQEFIVSAATLAELGISSAGITLTQASVETLQQESSITNLMDRALDALARTRRTRRELLLRLKKHEANADLIRIALDRLEALGLLSDEATARAEANSRLRAGEGIARIKQRLHQKGVSHSTATAALADVMADAIADGYDEIASCEAAAKRRAKSLGELPAQTAHRRLLAFLLRRGFPISIANPVARDVLAQHRHEE